MKIISNASELKSAGRKVCLAIGFFDGVHLGHQQIIRQTISDARNYGALSVVVTFDLHPSHVVAPARAPKLVYPLSRKLEVIGAQGSNALLLIHFDRAFSQQPGDVFIRGLARDFGQLQSLCVGNTFTFGYKRGGNVALLKTLGEELRFVVHGMSAVSLDGRIVSSTRIREEISRGNFDAAGQMLGRPYSLIGPVVRGDQMGRQLGFPTANLDVQELVLPPGGVYMAHAKIDGHSHCAMVNIGSRPTLASPTPQIRVEAHLLDFDGDLYGREVELVFLQKIRDEQRFPSLGALKEQIKSDIASARERF